MKLKFGKNKIKNYNNIIINFKLKIFLLKNLYLILLLLNYFKLE